MQGRKFKVNDSISNNFKNMKKRLESELISIAHRILKLKNKSEVDQLYKETQKLYETLSVLKFYQDNFESVKNDVSESVLEEKIEHSIDNEIAQKEILEVKEEITEPVVEAIVETEPEEEEETVVEDSIISEEVEELPEAILEEEIIVEEKKEDEPEIDEEEPVFKPIFELAVEDEAEEDIEPAETASEVTPETKKVALEEFLGENYVDPIFVKPNEVSLFSSETTETKQVQETKEEESKPASINTTFSKSIEIGLNDRIAFVNNLFGESNEDFNRVLSQLNTFDSFEEAKNFINEMVIPDYNYWVGKEDYLERFMEVVEKKFQ